MALEAMTLESLSKSLVFGDKIATEGHRLIN